MATKMVPPAAIAMAWPMPKTHLDEILQRDMPDIADKIENLYTIYLYAPHRATHLCSMMPSRELHHVREIATLKPGAELTEEQSEKLDTWLMLANSEAQTIEYANVRAVDRMPTINYEMSEYEAVTDLYEIDGDHMEMSDRVRTWAFDFYWDPIIQNRRKVA